MKSLHKWAVLGAIIIIIGLLLQNVITAVHYQFIKARYDKAPATKFMDSLIPCKSGTVGNTGGFCLDETNLFVGENNQWDVQICQDMEDLFLNSSVVDLGAGLGHYGKCLLRKKEFIFTIKDVQRKIKEQNIYITKMGELLNKAQVIKSWDGYDGAINVEILSNGFIKQQDLSVANLWLGRTWDWVVSLEVGEHVPPQYEDHIIDNLITHGCKGIILSWALEKQGGHYHVNGRSNDYIKQKIINRGLINDIKTEENIRSKASLPWFKRTLMVFRYPDDYKCESAP